MVRDYNLPSDPPSAGRLKNSERRIITMKIKSSKFSKALSLIISVALLLCSAAVLPANAVIETAVEKVVTEDFSTTSNLVYERSDFTTGMEGFKESGADLGDGTTETVFVKDGEKGVFDGAYKLAMSDQNQGWKPMWTYDSEKDKLVYRKKVQGVFRAPYKFTASNDNIVSIKEFSGRIFSENFGKDNNAPFIAFNYIDNGNVDMVYPYIENQIVYFRFFSIRTETVNSSAGTYKVIYESNLDQRGTESLTPVDATVNGVSLKYLDFKVVYGEDRVTVTFIDAANSISLTINDSENQARTVSSIIKEYDGTSERTVESFGKNTASKATQVGFIAYTSNAIYVDDLSLRYIYEKSNEQLANDFKAAHADILNKSIDDITSEDTVAYNAALSDYNALSDSAKALLAVEKAKLDAISEKLTNNIVDAYITANSDALALTSETVNKDNVALAVNALNGFNALDNNSQAKVTEKFNADKGTGYASLTDFLKEICNRVYYNADGALVYEDFTGYTKTDGAWGETDYRTIAKRGDKRIKSAEYVMKFDTSALASSFDKNPFFCYDSVEKDQSFNFTFSTYKADSWANKVFFNSRAVSNLNPKGYAGAHCTSDVIDSEEYPTLTMRVKYSYDYTVFDGEAEHFYSDTYVPYASNYISVDMQYSFDEIPGKVYKINKNMFAIIPNQGETLTDVFSVGFNTSSLPSGSSLKSLEIEYVSETASEQFEIYKDTYTKTVSDVALSDKDNINAALAVYETLTDEQKAKYQSNYENLLALSAVIRMIEDINAVSTSIPDALTRLETLEAAATGYNNSNIAGALAAQYSAVDTALRPTIDGATIKTTSEPSEQNLRFSATVKEAADGWYVKEVGVVMLPQDLLTGELTIETAKSVTAKTEYTAEKKAPANFLAQLSGSALNENRCARDIAARVYSIYTNGTDEYIYYSNNSGNNISGGTAVRSVYGVARSMAKAIVGTTEYGNVTYNDVVTSTSTPADIDNIDGKDILSFITANVDVIKAYVNANQNG